MKLINKYKNKHGKPELSKIKKLILNNISLNTKINNLQQLEYKKKNRKNLRINFRNFCLAGSLIGISKN